MVYGWDQITDTVSYTLAPEAAATELANPEHLIGLTHVLAA